ncbi:hypothetical protein HY638_03450 [Candidatus Woesearchaeota archaeon]|nr:hypothetical protein [Candidatus Woesearchaeota archaeon]
MGLDDVVSSLREDYRLQRLPDSEGAYALVSGDFIQVMQLAASSADPRISMRQSIEQLEQAVNAQVKDPRLRRALREKGLTSGSLKSLASPIRALANAALSGVYIVPWVGVVNREALALGIVRQTGLVWASSGEDVAGVFVVKSAGMFQSYGCMLLETGLISFANIAYLSPVSVKPSLMYLCQIMPPGVPVRLDSGQERLPEGEYQIATTETFFPSGTRTQRFWHYKKIDVGVFDQVFSGTFDEARRREIGKEFRIETYRTLSRCAEYAVMLVNASKQLRPVR